MVTALYRRYRPEKFAEMIGQAQVTEPLMTALRSNRVNHAYLFSGPRGCGKTTSARILARCLNCAEGPTDTPCGKCASCVELSRAGGGSLDVVEIDAASHNGVDDARDLRERAAFAPARDRFKIFILDEAHMVTSQGFNALLKLVEEPPEHVKFIFATTEPDKVLGTIRSRTHHYPFRLVAPEPMLDYVQQLCTEEGVTVEPGVLSLVVRAGGGSPRDTLSVLDQLIAGSEGATVGYERAVALLGYTPGAVLSDVVDALAAHDAGAAFMAVDRVIQTGQDPRRFVEDLLERVRDLIVVRAARDDVAASVLRDVPQDELQRMRVQADTLGPAELSRLADVINEALNHMTGTTSPRLQLELLVARALVPAVDDSTRGALARVERLERRIGVESGSLSDPVSPRSAPAAEVTSPESSSSVDTETLPKSPPAAQPTARGRAKNAEGTHAVNSDAPSVSEPAISTAAASSIVGPLTTEHVKNAWQEILAAVQAVKRSAWMVAFTARVIDVRDGDVLVLSFPSARDVAAFREPSTGNGVSEILRSAIQQVLGVTVKFITRVDAGDAEPVESTTQDYTAAAAEATTAAAATTAPNAVSRPKSSKNSEKTTPKESAADPSAPVDGWSVVPIPGDEDSPLPDEVAADEPPSETSGDSNVTVTQPKSKSSAPTAQYGEAVVREVLGAEFLEEEPRG